MFAVRKSAALSANGFSFASSFGTSTMCQTHSGQPTTAVPFFFWCGSSVNENQLLSRSSWQVYVTTKPSARLMGNIRRLEKRLGYTFRYPWLCMQAITHPSWTMFDRVRRSDDKNITKLKLRTKAFVRRKGRGPPAETELTRWRPNR